MNINDRLEEIKDYIELFEEASNRDDINKLYVELLNLYNNGHIDWMYRKTKSLSILKHNGSNLLKLLLDTRAENKKIS